MVFTGYMFTLFHTKDLNFCGFWNVWKVLLAMPHFYYGLIPGLRKSIEMQQAE